MHHDGIRPRDPWRLELKQCSACAVVKRAEDFYESQGRLWAVTTSLADWLTGVMSPHHTPRWRTRSP